MMSVRDASRRWFRWRNWAVAVASLWLSVSASGGEASGGSPKGAMAGLGQKLAHGVAKVSHASDAGHRRPSVLVLEESHNSRLQQVEQAIVLLRAYRDESMRDVVLEAYLHNTPPIPFDELHQTLPAPIRSRVALGRLERGEISSVEFMATVFDDVRVIQGESAGSHHVNVSDETPGKIVMTAIAIGAESLNQADQRQVMRILGQIEKTNDPKKQKDLFGDLRDLVGAKDPLAKQVLDMIYEPTAMPIEVEMTVLNKLRREADRYRGLEVTLPAIDEFIHFLQKRSDATIEMIDAAPLAKGQQPQPLAAIIMGAAHTRRAMTELAQRKRPFVVLTPASFDLEDDPSEYKAEEYERLSDGRPIRKGEISQQLVNLLGKKKYQPPSQYKWHRAESELMGLIELAKAGDGGGIRKPPPGGPPPGGPPPGGDYQMGDPRRWFNGRNGWRGEHWFVAAPSIVWLDEDNQPIATIQDVERDPDQKIPQKAGWIMFDAQLTSARDQDHQVTYTVKVNLGEAQAVRDDILKFREDAIAHLETVLVQAHDRLLNQSDVYRSPQRKDGLFQIRPTIGLDVIIGRGRDQVRQAIVDRR